MNNSSHSHSVKPVESSKANNVKFKALQASNPAEFLDDNTCLFLKEAEELLDLFGVTLLSLVQGTCYIGQGEYRDTFTIVKKVVDEDKAEQVMKDLGFEKEEVWV